MPECYDCQQAEKGPWDGFDSKCPGCVSRAFLVLVEELDGYVAITDETVEDTRRAREMGMR